MLRSLLLLSLSIMIFASPAGATILAEAGIRDLGQGFTPVPICQNGTFGDSFASASCSAGGNDGSARAQTSYGSLEVYAELSSDVAMAGNGDYQAFGRSMFSDVITLESPLLTPGIGTFVNLTLDVSGTILRDGPEFGEPGSMFAFADIRLTVNGIEEGANTSSLTGPRTYSFRMFPNSPALLLVELIGRVECFGCDLPYEGIVDFFGTAEVTSIAAEGLSFDDFTMTSGNNQHYANVVPEPNAAILICVGLLGLSAKGRGQRG
jgi:hypothetical protein